jgi:uncharacterized protein YabE (DUF348 family)
MATTSLNRIRGMARMDRLTGRRRDAVVLLVAVCALWMLWAATAMPVTVLVDGTPVQVVTHRETVGQLLLDLGLELDTVDRVEPAATTPLRAGTTILIERARPVQIVVDGKTVQGASWGDTPTAVLAEIGIMVDAHDQVLVSGETLDLEASLPPRQVVAALPAFAPVRPWARTEVIPLQMRVVRAVPLVVDDGTLPFVIRTTAATVGEALRGAEITIYLGDRVVPSLGSAVTTGLRVTIQRSIPVSIQLADRLVKTRTRGETVADALTDMRVGVSGLDRVDPPLDSALYEGIKIGVTRVLEEIEIQEEIAPFDTVYVADPNLAIDTQQMMTPGAEGITRTRYRVRYEDQQEVVRTLEDTWVAQEPAERTIAYGQQIEPRTFTAADGRSFTYWRRIRMLASSYSANTAGVSPDKSYYGQTYTGDPMRFGIVAVDPRIIPLRSQVYVSDYGVGDALDTGSAIVSRRIDLGYDDSNLVLWNRWVDVYLLWPPPPAAQITWVIPNWPRPPQ